MVNGAIGLFDSGVGGLSVFLELSRQLPNESVIYFADTKHMPYGARSKEELQQLVFAILDWMMTKQVKLVIMACNTSSALVLDLARERYKTPLVGMIEPTVLALAGSQVPCLGIIATEATIRSNKYPEELRQAGYSGRLLCQPCQRLASLIEGSADQSELESAVGEYLLPLRQAGVEQLVLACTHYPFAKDTIAAYMGEQVELVDPAAYVVQCARDLLRERQLLSSPSEPVRHRFYASGSVEQFELRARQLLGRSISAQAAHFELIRGMLKVRA